MRGNNRIAIIITGLSFGGAERVTSYLANYFATQGRDVYLIALSMGERAYYLSEAIEVIELGQDVDQAAFVRYWRLIRAIRLQLKRIKPSIVLGMMSFAGSVGAIANIGLRSPFIISERNDPHLSTITSPVEKRVFRYIFRNFTTRAIFQSEGAKSFYFPSHDPRGVVIANPLFVDQMPAPNEHIVRSHTIVSAGRLNHQKNYPFLIKAFKEVHAIHPEYRLIIYGEGEERHALEALVKKLGLEDVISLPGVERDIFSKLKEAEMFVISSDFEGMPNALIEAMAMGLPCITTDYSDGRGTVITHDVDGVVVPRGDTKALKEAMLTLIEDDIASERIATEATKIRTRLDATIICRRWYDEIAGVEDAYYSP